MSKLIDFASSHSKGITAFGCGYDGALLHQLLCSRLPVREVHVFRPAESVRIGPKVDLSHSARKLTTVTTLAIHLSPSRFKLKSCTGLRAIQEWVSWPWTKIFPNLETIRVMEGVDVEMFSLHNSISQLNLNSMGRWARKSLRVEDINGRLLAEFSAGISVLVGVPMKLSAHCSAPYLDAQSDLSRVRIR
ncbi:hypothetical protein BKA70DRAFT_1266395 [Coprinopsis sp. MPI-PUGE-AT-0042]|nr:hypothetical protein BKA70DRAFT_1266395 [Coprinopsis sp. MPI-PUGE-AT-0042]